LATASEERTSTSWQGVIRLWDVATGKGVQHMKVEQRMIEELGWSPVTAVRFSPEGRMLVSAGKSLRLWEVATAQQRRRLPGHEGEINSVDFSPDGRLLVSSSWSDRTVLVWDLIGESPTRPLSAAELQRHWEALASTDAAKAYPSIRALTAAPKQAVPFLRERLKPAIVLDPVRLAKLLRDLESPRFIVRDVATKELEQLGDVALLALRKAKQGNLELKRRRRLEQLIEHIEGWPPETLRAWRALEVLEQVGTPEARRLLQALARGAAEARLTREAGASLERLARQAASKERPRKD
jgi:hypothetical protein